MQRRTRVHIGGSARCYQAIFVPSTALASPGYDGQPAVYLYIAAFEVNVLKCRKPGAGQAVGPTVGAADSGFVQEPLSSYALTLWFAVRGCPGRRSGPCAGFAVATGA